MGAGARLRLLRRRRLQSLAVRQRLRRPGARLVSAAKALGARGWNFDLEPQKHKPASTAHDALAFASFCARTRSALHAVGMRLTVSVAQWCPMLKNYTLLAPTADRLFDMETYNANSFDGWLHGDSFGGYYLQLLNGTNHSAVAPALGCWNQTCGGQPCWTSTQPSVRPRLG